MYNGVGLQTARGSGIDGHGQINRFFTNLGAISVGGPGGSHGHGPPLPGADGGGIMRKPNKEVLDEHDRKRQVELKLLVLRDALEERGYTEDEVEERVEEARKAAAAEEAGCVVVPGDRLYLGEDTLVAARKEKQLETVRASFGLVDIEDAKEEDGESDVESMEIVAGKYYEELDTAGQKKYGKDSKVATKSQKEKGTATRVYAEVEEGPTFEMTFIMGKRKTKEEEERDNNYKRFWPIILNQRRKTKEEEERE